jgi:FHS family L-fucose permease-like MFS transporter
MTSSQESAVISSEAPVTTDTSAMAMVSILFFAWGFITVLNDILIPHLKNIFQLDYAEVMLVQFSFFGSYFVFSLPSGRIIEAVGYSRAMAGGLLAMGCGAFLFIPAASIASFPMFLTALIVLAAGMTLLQTSANPYVAILGPAKTASSRMNLAQGFNSLGTTLAPLFGSMLILGSTVAPLTTNAQIVSAAQFHAHQVQEAASVKMPYFGLAVALVALAAIIATYKFPVIAYAEARILTADSIWRHKRLLFGALAIFLYVGAEVAIGSFMTNYLNHNEIGNLSLRDAARYLQYYWGGAMVGRFAGSGALQRLDTRRLLGFNATMAALLVTLSILSLGSMAMWSMILVGLFNSIMFPSIFTVSIEGLGPLTGRASSLLVAAIVGGAVIPELQGVLADHIGVHHAFLLPGLCYVYILWFAMKGASEGNYPKASVHV